MTGGKDEGIKKMNKLDAPLYHGTSKAAAIYIVGGYGFNAPIHLTADKKRAEHYAKAATAYLEKLCNEKGTKPIADGYAIFTFRSVPDKDDLVVDDYNLIAEPDQYKYLKPIRGLAHFTAEYHPLKVSNETHLSLQCFAIGMWSR